MSVESCIIFFLRHSSLHLIRTCHRRPNFLLPILFQNDSLNRINAIKSRSHRIDHILNMLIILHYLLKILSLLQMLIWWHLCVKYILFFIDSILYSFYTSILFGFWVIVKFLISIGIKDWECELLFSSRFEGICLWRRILWVADVGDFFDVVLHLVALDICSPI